MPCYSVRTISVEFHAENVDLLKKALLSLGFSTRSGSNSLNVYDKSNRVTTIDFSNSQISSKDSFYNEKNLTNFANQIKRAYSLEVINKVASAGKWFQKRLANNKIQLQRY